jgi:hypothetical protein
MTETPRNPDIEQIIRASLAETKEWGWEDEDRKWSACGAALKYLEANSTMSPELAHGMALKIVEEIMAEPYEPPPGDDIESIEGHIQEINEQEASE